MNSIWNNNITQFAKRFPQLYALIADELHQCGTVTSVQDDAGSDSLSLAVTYPCGWTVHPAKNGQLSAFSDAGRLHSAYDPGREAEQLALSFKDSANRISAFVFLGFGLGYAPDAAAKKYSGIKLILIEPDIACFAAALAAFDWSAIFEHSDCILCIAAPHQNVIALLESAGIDSCKFIRMKTVTGDVKHYFDSLNTLIERNRNKNAVNMKTLEKFASLWRRNSCRNLRKLAELDGIKRYENTAEGLSACVLAAGPSLDTVLPYLAEIKKRCLLICVDTALRACLCSGVEPDFIILVDPQYWNSRHLDRLSVTDSILITEVAAYPSVFRFSCREIILCSSLYPIGKYFEAHCGCKGELGAGGSVAASAWNFARLCGCFEIFIAGLDLGFPGKKTHSKGSTFEERIHTVSNRFQTAEYNTAAALFSAEITTVRDYANDPLLTDKRMSLYAWWFESNVASHSENKTYSLTESSFKIPGIEYYPLERLLERPCACIARRRFFDCEKTAHTAFEQTRSVLQECFLHTLVLFKDELDNIYSLAKRGERLCSSHLECRNFAEFAAGYAAVSAKLAVIDQNLLSSSITETASLVFPTPDQLDSIFSDSDLPIEPMRETLSKSRIIYRQVLNAISGYQRLLAE